MAQPQHGTGATIDDLYKVEGKAELVDGELLVTPAPRALHQRVQLRLLLELGNYLRDQPIGELYASPADISWTVDTLVQPDLFVVEISEARTLPPRRAASPCS